MYLSALKMMVTFSEIGLYSPWVDEPALTLPSSDKKIVAQKIQMTARVKFCEGLFNFYLSRHNIGTYSIQERTLATKGYLSIETTTVSQFIGSSITTCANEGEGVVNPKDTDMSIYKWDEVRVNSEGVPNAVMTLI